MPGDRMNAVAQMIGQGLIFVLAAAVVWGVLRKLIKNVFGKMQTAGAKVLDKYTTSHEAVSNVGPARTMTDCVVVFDVGGRTMRFLTSMWIYDSIRKGEKGVLKYKGDRLVSFDR